MTPSTLTNSSMGLGLAALGRPAYINLGHGDDVGRNKDVTSLEQRTHQVLDAAYQSGIRYFDAARSYGRAEEFLASWLNKTRPSGVFIASKWGYTYTADWQIEAEKHEVKDHSFEALRRQWQESKNTLGGHLDLYQIHSVVPETGVLENSVVLNELFRLKQSGIKIGFSVSGLLQADMIRRAIEIRFENNPLFDSVQATFNLLEQSAGSALVEAHEAGLKIIVKEGLANGRLTGRNRQIEDINLVSVLENNARLQNTTIDALCLKYVLQQRFQPVVLSGAATIDHLHSNMAALHLQPVSPQLAAELRSDPVNYWQQRSEMPWQ